MQQMREQLVSIYFSLACHNPNVKRSQRTAIVYIKHLGPYIKLSIENLVVDEPAEDGFYECHELEESVITTGMTIMNPRIHKETPSTGQKSLLRSCCSITLCQN